MTPARRHLPGELDDPGRHARRRRIMGPIARLGQVGLCASLVSQDWQVERGVLAELDGEGFVLRPVPVEAGVSRRSWRRSFRASTQPRMA
jgi:hypothetical protein